MTNRYGTAADIADALDHYNTWRRGANSPAPDPVALGRTIEAAAHTLRELEREVTHWKANHATEVRRARILKERTDMPIERTLAYAQWGADIEELTKLRNMNDGALFVGAGKRKYQQLRNEGFNPVGLALQKDDQRCWISGAGMVLWPRLETEVSDEKAELANLRREVARLRGAVRIKDESANLYFRNYKELKQRTDELSTLDSERAANAQLTEENERLKSLRFPVELRKMWSGSEVQQWLDEQFAK